MGRNVSADDPRSDVRVTFHEPHVDGREAEQGDQVQRRLVCQQGKREIGA